MSIVHLLLLNAAIAAISFLIAWRVAVAIRDVTFIDAYWAIGMVIIAAATFLATPAVTARKLVLFGLCLAWGLRLGAYLIWRWQSHGPDRRYVTMMSKAQSDRGWGFATASLALVFATQAPLQFIVCLPVQLGQLDAEPSAFGWLGWAGAALCVTGIGFESVGDWQLARFKADPGNQGKVMETGLWSLPGPVLITFLLLKWSGVPTVERRLRKNRPGYEDYVRRTSGFIPWPPKAPTAA